MNVLSTEKKLTVISTLVEGNSIRSIERMTGIHRDTIMRLTLTVGERCQTILDEQMRGLQLRHVEVDEIWTYVGKHQGRLAPEQRHDPKIGDQYVFVALDASTKLVPWFEVGKRNMVTAYRMMDNLKNRLTGRFQLTTDGFVPYIGAVDRAWGMDAPDFGQLVKLFGARCPLVRAVTARRRCWRLYQRSFMGSRTPRTSPRRSWSGRISRSGWRAVASRDSRTPSARS